MPSSLYESNIFQMTQQRFEQSHLLHCHFLVDGCQSCASCQSNKVNERGLQKTGFPSNMIPGTTTCMYHELVNVFQYFDPKFLCSWIVYSASTFDNIIKNLQQQLVDTTEADRNHVVLDSAERGFHAFARALSECLENREYLCGNRCVLFFTYCVSDVLVHISVSVCGTLYFMPWLYFLTSVEIVSLPTG